MIELTDLGLRCALCNAIVRAFGKSLPGNTTGECTVTVKGNVLAVKTGIVPAVAVVDMTFTHPAGRNGPTTFSVIRAGKDANDVQMTGTDPMRIEELAAHIFRTFVAALRARE